MPRRLLTVIWDGTTIFDGDVEELVFTDNDTGIKVEGRIKRAQAGGGFLDILAAAAKPKPAPTQEDSA